MNKKELKNNLVSFRYKVLTKLGVMDLLLLDSDHVFQLMAYVTPEEQYAYMRYYIEKHDYERYVNRFRIEDCLDNKKCGHTAKTADCPVLYELEVGRLKYKDVVEALRGNTFEIDGNLYLRSAQQKALDQMFFEEKNKYDKRSYKGYTDTLMAALSDEQIDSLAKIAEQDFAERLECGKYKNMKEYQSETLSMALDAIILEHQSHLIKRRLSQEYNLNENGVGRLRTYNDKGEEISPS